MKLLGFCHATQGPRDTSHEKRCEGERCEAREKSGAVGGSDFQVDGELGLGIYGHGSAECDQPPLRRHTRLDNRRRGHCGVLLLDEALGEFPRQELQNLSGCTRKS